MFEKVESAAILAGKYIILCTLITTILPQLINISFWSNKSKHLTTNFWIGKESYYNFLQIQQFLNIL